MRDWIIPIGMTLLIIAVIPIAVESKRDKPQPQPVYAPTQYAMEVMK